MEHDYDAGEGENLYVGGNPLEASQLWYGENSLYPEKDNYMEHPGIPANHIYNGNVPTNKMDGHFTQVRETDA